MSLIDTFMPNDLCARCDEGEPVDDLKVRISVAAETANLHFCSYACKERFVRGAAAVKELPDVL
jgi:hypothetical protein